LVDKLKKITLNLKQTALCLTGVFLFLSGPINFEWVENPLTAGKPTRLASQHLSNFCNGTCSSATFVHSSGQTLIPVLFPSFEPQAIFTGNRTGQTDHFWFFIRPPPFFLII
jgi:hypothetical protein